MQWKYKRLSCSLLILLTALTALDILTTRYILNGGGIELNPFMAPAVDHLLLIKIAAIIVVSCIAVYCERVKAGSGPVPFALFSMVTLIPVSWNLAYIGGL